MTVVANALAEGGILGRYALVAAVPSGDGQEVWLAKRTDPGTSSPPVLLRLLPDDLARDDARLRSVRAEAALAAAWEHPHLAQMLELAVEDGRAFLVSEYVSGRTLRQIQNRAEALRRIPPIWFTLEVARRIAECLAYLHARLSDPSTGLFGLRQVVSPDSIVVSFTGEPKLCAFGFGLPTSPRTESAAGPLNRAFAYVAPERIAAPPKSGAEVARSDVYSLGVVLYEAVTGRDPFDTGASEDLLRELLDERRDPIPPSIVAPWVTQPLEDIILRAIARDPGTRFPDAKALRDAITGYMGWAGLTPERRHLAQQVCGVVAHADSEPPPSARSHPSLRPAPSLPAPAESAPRAEARSPEDAGETAPGARRAGAAEAWDRAAAEARRLAGPARSSPPLPAEPAGPSAEPPLARPSGDDPSRGAPPARGTAAPWLPRLPSPDTTAGPGAVEPTRAEHGPSAAAENEGEGPRHFWDRIVEQQQRAPTPVPESVVSPAIQAFEAGLELARNGRYAEALVELEQALRMDPNNRVYGANLRRVQRALEQATGR